MPSALKFLIGLAAVLIMGFVWHGPLGNGAQIIDALEAQARAAVAEGELPGIAVNMARDPLARRATISGQANDLQREGMGETGMGLKDYVRSVEGISSVRWSDEPEAGGLPLLAETLILIALAFLIGFGLARLLFGRRKRDSYL
jgi:hypothetical protein